MTGYLVPISKSRRASKPRNKKGSGPQARNQANVPRDQLVEGAHPGETRLPKHVATEIAHPIPAPVHSPVPAPVHSPVVEAPGATIVRRGSRMPKLLIGSSLLAAGGGGAYAYRRRRAEKGLAVDAT